MAVTLMAGLSFGTILTMVLVPVLYVMVYGISTAPAASAQPALQTSG